MRSAVRPLFATLAGLAVTLPAFAGAVYLKDGYTLHGNVKQDQTLIADPATGQMIPVIKATGYFIVDDRFRWVIFSHQAVQNADPELNVRRDFLEFLNPTRIFNQDGKLPKEFRVDAVGKFDARWQRNVGITGTWPDENGIPRARKFTIAQRIMSLSPYGAKVQSLRYPWGMCYLTQELGPDVTAKLLNDLPELADTDKPDIEKRMKKFRFLLQAGWLPQAEAILDQALSDLPDQKERIERSRVTLKQFSARAAWQEAEAAHKAGRYRATADALKGLPVADLDAKSAADAAILRGKVEAADKQMATARRLLKELGKDVAAAPFAAALPAIDAELGADTLDRLEPFVTLGTQFEKDQAAGRESNYTREAVLALAVTGWALGRESAEPRAETAVKVWATREFVQNYLRTVEAGGRKKLLDAYQQAQPLGIDEMSQLVSLLPPPEPAEVQVPATGLMECKTAVPWSKYPAVDYLLQPPAEYQPGRSYPVLIVLHAADEQPAAALARWSAEAKKHGFFLAAPKWGGDQGYNYSAEEHAAVTELVKDLRRRYPVDSDRVFLTGFNLGATMAFDVGLSHPDLFAGVLPINGTPYNSTTGFYQRNGQYLPFFSVVGEHAGVNMSHNRLLYEVWCGRGYSSLLTVYKGRVSEFYSAEVPFAFDWMSRKKRANGFPALGRNFGTGNQSEEFVSWRPTDNRFYWVSVDAFNDRFMNPDIGKRQPTPAAVQAEIRDGNQIVVNTRGVKKAKVWLGRTWDPVAGARQMIDTAKPVTVTVNRVAGKPTTVTPSLAVLLEDLFERGDRQRLFYASIDLTNLQ